MSHQNAPSVQDNGFDIDELSRQSMNLSEIDITGDLDMTGHLLTPGQSPNTSPDKVMLPVCDSENPLNTPVEAQGQKEYHHDYPRVCDLDRPSLTIQQMTATKSDSDPSQMITANKKLRVSDSDVSKSSKDLPSQMSNTKPTNTEPAIPYYAPVDHKLPPEESLANAFLQQANKRREAELAEAKARIYGKGSRSRASSGPPANTPQPSEEPASYGPTGKRTTTPAPYAVNSRAKSPLTAEKEVITQKTTPLERFAVQKAQENEKLITAVGELQASHQITRHQLEMTTAFASQAEAQANDQAVKLQQKHDELNQVKQAAQTALDNQQKASEHDLSHQKNLLITQGSYEFQERERVLKQQM